MESMRAIHLLALEVVYQNRLLDQNRMLSLRFNYERLLRSVTGVVSLKPPYETQKQINNHNHQLFCRHDIRIQTQLR